MTTGWHRHGGEKWLKCDPITKNRRVQAALVDAPRRKGFVLQYMDKAYETNYCRSGQRGENLLFGDLAGEPDIFSEDVLQGCSGKLDEGHLRAGLV
jgi:hypothetical protein